jgi:hypothetical protein
MGSEAANPVATKTTADMIKTFIIKIFGDLQTHVVNLI